MTRPQTHLKEIQAAFGSGGATDSVRALLQLGMERKLASEPDDWNGKVLHISDAGKCPRQVYFRLTGAPRAPMTLDSWMTLNLGKKAEELYTELLLSAGVRILSQQTISLERDGETITGTLDMLLEIPESVREIVPGLDPVEVWELKTKNSRAMGLMLKQGGPQADDGYRKQVRGYLQGAAEGKVPAPTHARGRLIYTAVGATKGEPLFHAWYVEADEAEVEADLQKLAEVGKAAREGREPAIPEGFEFSKFPCSYCDYRPHCQRQATHG